MSRTFSKFVIFSNSLDLHPRIGGVDVPYVEIVLTEKEIGDGTATPPIVDPGGIARASNAVTVPTLNGG